MPLVRISVPANRDASYRRGVSDAVHQALVDVIGVPPADRFQIITAHDAEGLIFDPSYLDARPRRSAPFTARSRTRSTRRPERASRT